MWEKPSYEIIDVCAEVTAYVYKDGGDQRKDSSGRTEPRVTNGKAQGAGVQHDSALPAEPLGA